MVTFVNGNVGVWNPVIVVKNALVCTALGRLEAGRDPPNYPTWNAKSPSPRLMLDGDAKAAPAPNIAAPAANTESAIDITDRFTSTRPFAAGDLLSMLAVMLFRLVPKGKQSLSELDEFGGES
jgi:hypothetical protein